MAARTTPTTAPAFLAPALTLPPQETLRLLQQACAKLTLNMVVDALKGSVTKPL